LSRFLLKFVGIKFLHRLLQTLYAAAKRAPAGFSLALLEIPEVQFIPKVWLETVCFPFWPTKSR